MLVSLKASLLFGSYFVALMSVTTYKTPQDLSLLKQWLFDPDTQTRALLRVKALQSRGRIPHGLESTAQLIAIIRSDARNGESGTFNDSKADTYSLQMAYSMAIVRFVNGLLDPFQQGAYALPLHLLAKEIQLPSFFVELRHMSTHEQLPGLEILRLGARRAVEWLKVNYWTQIEDFTSAPSLKKDRIAVSLRTYKKIRKLNMESEPLDPNYRKCMDILRRTRPIDVVRPLVYEYLVVGRRVLPLVVKVYRPLLEELGRDFQLLVFRELARGTFTDEEAPQAQAWLEVLVEELVGLDDRDIGWRMVEYAGKNPVKDTVKERLGLGERIATVDELLGGGKRGVVFGGGGEWEPRPFGS